MLAVVLAFAYGQRTQTQAQDSFVYNKPPVYHQAQAQAQAQPDRQIEALRGFNPYFHSYKY